MRLPAMLAEGIRDCIGEALRVIRKAPRAFADVAIGVDPLPSPDAHRIMKETPIQPDTARGPRRQKLAQRSSDTMTSVSLPYKLTTQCLTSRVHTLQEHYQFCKFGDTRSCRRARTIPAEKDIGITATWLQAWRGKRRGCKAARQLPFVIVDHCVCTTARLLGCSA